MKEGIHFEDFNKVELRVGTVIEAVPVEDSHKLLRLVVDVGEEKRQIISGIKKAYAPEDLVGVQVVVVVNLEPKSLAGLESKGMILAAHDKDGLPVLLRPADGVPNGSEVS